jgi:hypothetical protein
MFVPVTVARKRKSKEEGAKTSTVGPGKPRPVDESRKYVNGVSLLAAFLVWIVGVAVAIPMTVSASDGVKGGVFVGIALLGLLALFAIKVANQWEKAVLLRFGRYRGLRGPGLFVLVPVESALTRDTVPVNVDAIVFWLVWDAEKSILEVESYFDAIFLSAQTALREAIGRHDLAEMITEREKLGAQLQQILDAKTNPWGITIQSVEIRDVRIRAGGRHVAPGPGRAGAAGAHHPRHRRDRDRGEVRQGLGALQGQPGRHAPPRHEHALRGDQGEGQHGHRALLGGGDHGPGRLHGPGRPRRRARLR